MARYCDTPHLNELLGTRGTTPPEECTYCERAFSKGFKRCPSCEHDFQADPMNDEREPVFPEKRAGVVMED